MTEAQANNWKGILIGAIVGMLAAWFYDRFGKRWMDTAFSRTTGKPIGEARIAPGAPGDGVYPELFTSSGCPPKNCGC